MPGREIPAQEQGQGAQGPARPSVRQELTRQKAAIDQNRRTQVGSGERAEKIRTYNFPQNRVTDHRIGLTVHNLSAVLEGDLDDLIQALATHEQAERLKALS